MKISVLEEKNRKSEKVAVAFDVGQSSLNMYLNCKLNDKWYSFEDEIPNRSKAIYDRLVSLSSFVKRKSDKELCIVCEPTGGYEKTLLRVAGELNIERAYVSGEAVSKLKVVKNNSSGKTDTLDPLVISMVHECGKSFKVRDLGEIYGRLRLLNESYDHFRDNRRVAKCRLHHIVKKIFCDFSFKSKFLYEKSGRALIELFSIDPERVLAAGFTGFEKTMKEAAPRIRSKTIQRIWDDAESSESSVCNPREKEILVSELEMTWQEFLLFEKNTDIIREQIICTYHELRLADKSIPNNFHHLISEFSMGRVLGETGALNDFKSINQLMKYAGLNIRERKSGKYTGKCKIDKKGRARLRNILHLATLPLLANGKAFAEEYQVKKKRMIPGKAQMAMTRKLLKVIYALNKNKTEFNNDRLFVCESKILRDKKVA